MSETRTMVCATCKGAGTIYHPCSECGDSTWDHYCDDSDEPCPDCAAKGLPSKVEVPCEDRRKTP